MKKYHSFGAGLAISIVLCSSSALASDGQIIFKGGVYGSDTCAVDIANQSGDATLSIDAATKSDLDGMEINTLTSTNAGIFNINLSGCAGLGTDQKPSIKFDEGAYGNTETDSYRNYYADDAGQGDIAATGISLAIGNPTDSTFTPIDLESATAAGEFVSTGTGEAQQWSKQFAVRYMKTQPQITSGVFETMATFTIVYN